MTVQCVTTESIAGRTVAESLGIVVGCVPWFGSTYAEGVKDLAGNASANVEAVYEARRLEALIRMSANALRRHADAVLCVRFSVREINSTWRELCAYGTAVRLDPREDVDA